MNMTIDNLKAGVMEPEARDKGKEQKYAKDSDHLPEYVKSLIDEKSQAINRLYSRQGDGTLKLNLQDPLFQEASTMYERNYSSTMDDAYPRSIMINMFFRGDQAAFDEALRDGDIYETENKKKGGKPFYAFTKYRVASEEGKKKDHRLQSSKAVNNAVADELLQAFQSDLDKKTAHPPSHSHKPVYKPSVHSTPYKPESLISQILKPYTPRSQKVLGFRVWGLAFFLGFKGEG